MSDLLQVALAGDIEALKQACAARSEDELSQCLVDYAAGGADDADVVDVLIVAGADVDHGDALTERSNIDLPGSLDGTTALMYAAYHNSLAVLAKLRTHLADVDVETDEAQWSALEIATQKDHVSAARFLIEQHAEINERQDGKAGSMLHVAAECGSLKVATLLLEKDDSIINEVNENSGSETALHCACESDHVEIVHLLMKAEASVDMQDIEGRTALHRACAEGNRECIEALIEYGAEVNQTMNGGFTALHLAVKRGDTELVDLLLEHGAKANARDGEGRRPVDLALEIGNNLVADVLRQAGEDDSDED
eukprot:GEMP01072994.1.p1 GENE.GEMP01072994.1~~GEMP01072994.1.p1  ORF type:complete len:310 (+),score=85.89 GEMP01072994.1:23-952(+)